MESFSVAASVICGRIQLTDPDGYKFYVSELEEGQKVTVTVADGEVRTLAANRYLWQIYTWIQKETGQPKESTHAEMCALFLKHRATYIDPRTNLTVEREWVGGSSGLTPRQFHEFVENVRLHAAEWHGITIKDPDPAYRRERAEVLKEAA